MWVVLITASSLSFTAYRQDVVTGVPAPCLLAVMLIPFQVHYSRNQKMDFYLTKVRFKKHFEVLFDSEISHISTLLLLLQAETTPLISRMLLKDSPICA